MYNYREGGYVTLQCRHSAKKRYNKRIRCLSGKVMRQVCASRGRRKRGRKAPRFQVGVESIFEVSLRGWDKTDFFKIKGKKIKKKGGTELGEESGVKCDRLAQHVLATEGRPVPSATMEDFLPPPSFSRSFQRRSTG